MIFSHELDARELFMLSTLVCESMHEGLMGEVLCDGDPMGYDFMMSCFNTAMYDPSNMTFAEVMRVTRENGSRLRTFETDDLTAVQLKLMLA